MQSNEDDDNNNNNKNSTNLALFFPSQCELEQG